ncbi:MAG TPA: hypothetical protein VFX92_09075 [Candidatus Krumholzibacteria bacterium]|nr:hypothetical protein [Candidatus Krumholzibacteria bacterium]
MTMRAFTRILLIVLTVATSSPAHAAEPLWRSVSLRPVWSMALQGDSAVVVHNELDARGLVFPLPAVRVYDTSVIPPTDNLRAVVLQEPQVATLPVHPNGTITANLSFVQQPPVVRTPPVADSSRSLSALYVSDDGAWMMATEQGKTSSIADDRFVWIDVATRRTEYVHGVEGGDRYYSGDSQTMAVVQPGGGILRLYSLRDVPRAVLLGEYKTDMIPAACINEDGSLIAVQGMSEVNVLNRSLHALGTIRPQKENGHGVLIAGDVLFVGMRPSDDRILVPMRRIDAFDLRDLPPGR